MGLLILIALGGGLRRLMAATDSSDLKAAEKAQFWIAALVCSVVGPAVLGGARWLYVTQRISDNAWSVIIFLVGLPWLAFVVILFYWFLLVYFPPRP
jgi:hypothetical protein